jgi:fructose-specific phosphotransferase system IIC component
VQGDTWPLLELFKDKTEEPIQVIMDWLEPLVKEAINRKAKRREANGETPRSARVMRTPFSWITSLIGQMVFTFFLFVDVALISLSISDVEHIRYELITFLIASRDTVSAQTFFRRAL